MRIVFMGTPAFSVPSLLACLELGEVVAVVTQPDKPSGRGQALGVSAVKAAALERGIPVLQPAKLKTPPFAEVLKALAPDVAVVTAYGRILPADVLAVPGHGCLNLHASLLPRFRGAAPIQWALASGDAQTGVCLMQMDVGLDTGPVLDREVLDILPTDTSATLHEKLAALGGVLLRRSLLPALKGERPPVPQASEGVVLAPMIEKEAGRLDFTRPAVELERRLRAFTPWPGGYFHTEAGLVKVHGAQVAAGRGPPGAVLAAGAHGVELACGEGSLLLTTLQAEGKRPLAAKDFLAGRQVPVGTVWPRPSPGT
jgi:methionyl-tRNA formyltransferase